jgi:hypothetical protein
VTRRCLALCLLCASVAGCAGAPRAFVADQRLRITSPTVLGTVTTPFSVSWTGSRPGDHSYAVFVDRMPFGPGETVRDLADRQCKHEPGCPDAEYLAGLGVYVTTSQSVEVTHLVPLGGTAGRASHPVHTLTVIALDGRGRRRGEAAWTVEFRA